MYLLGAAFQDIHNPTPCENVVEGSSGNANSRIAAKGIAEPELICERIILPPLGKCLARTSPIFPPNKAPTKSVHKNAVFLCEKPINSNHIGAKDSADQGIDPDTP